MSRARRVRLAVAAIALAVPDHAAAQPASADAAGCWVHAFAQKQFRPPVTTYTGPRHEPLFMRDASSVIVGPGARLVGYAGNRYRKETLDLQAGARVPDLEAIGFDRRVDAFKVVCAG